MADLLVKLYGLPASAPVIEKLSAAGAVVREGSEPGVYKNLIK